MKRTCFCISFFLFVLIAISSCNKDKTEEKAPHSPEIMTAFENLKIDLNDFNAEFFKDHPQVQTRGKGWWKYVVGADLTGAAAFGFHPASWVLGAFMSILTVSAINEPDSVIADVTEEIDDYMPDDEPDWDYVDNAGYYHNRVILDFFEEYGDAAISVPTEEMIEFVKNKAIEYGVDESDLDVFTTEYVTGQAEIIIEAIVDECIEDAFEELDDIYPDIEPELGIIEMYVVGLSLVNSVEQQAIYTETFTNKVKEAKLPKKSELIIRRAISVGNGSNRLWRVKQ